MKVRRYSIARARAKLPGLVRAAARGASIEITRRGEPVAVLLSVRERDRLAAGRRSFGEAYDAFLARHAADLPAFGKRYFDSLRDRSAGRAVRL